MAFSGQGYVVKPHDNLGWKPQVVTNEDLYRELQYINATHSVVNGHLQDVRLALDAMQVAMRADQERRQFVQAELRTMMSRLADLVRKPFRTAPIPLLMEIRGVLDQSIECSLHRLGRSLKRVCNKELVIQRLMNSIKVCSDANFTIDRCLVYIELMQSNSEMSRDPEYGRKFRIYKQQLAIANTAFFFLMGKENVMGLMTQECRTLEAELNRTPVYVSLWTVQPLSRQRDVLLRMRAECVRIASALRNNAGDARVVFTLEREELSNRALAYREAQTCFLAFRAASRNAMTLCGSNHAFAIIMYNNVLQRPRYHRGVIWTYPGVSFLASLEMSFGIDHKSARAIGKHEFDACIESAAGRFTVLDALFLEQIAPGHEIVVDTNGDVDQLSVSSTSSWDGSSTDGAWTDGVSISETDSVCEVESEMPGRPESESTCARSTTADHQCGTVAR